MKRRTFLKSSAIASTAFLMPAFMHGANYQNLEARRNGKKLVVVQWSGGNDGLNTVVPFENDIYYRNRPNLNISKKEVIRLTHDLGFHPALQPIQSLFEKEQINIINSVGYPNPDRSHFRSMDIWQTGSGSDEYWSTGWIGRYLDSNCGGCEKAHAAVEVNDGLSLALKGKVKSGFAARNSRQLKRVTNNQFLNQIANKPHHHEENLNYLYKTLVDTQSSADYLYQQSKLYRSTVSYPKSKFAKDLKQIAELMTADTDTQIYYVSMGGFDTHVAQKSKQARLLKEYAEGMNAFMQDLKNHRMENEVLIMTFSEFGRRVKQNASGGTDHGTANNVFLMNGRLKQGGFYNAAPNLSNLDKGDLRYQVDFRNIYATILEDWLEVDSELILKKRFPKLKLL